MKHTVYILILLFIGCRKTSTHDVYETMASTKQYLIAESELIFTVKNYVSSQEEKLLLLKRQLDEMEKVHSGAENSEEDFLSNPVNTFHLIKRLTKTFEKIKKVMKIEQQGPALELMATLSGVEEMLQYPERKALSSIARVLMLLQKIYQLEIPQIAKGIIKGMKPAYAELSGEDCVDIGMQSYNQNDFAQTVLWLKEALARYEKEVTDNLVTVLDYLSYSLYKTGDLINALALTNRLLGIQPDHERALQNKAAYEYEIDEKNKKLIENFDLQSIYESTTQDEEKEEEEEKLSTEEGSSSYSRLCRGESRLRPAITKKFFCYFQKSSAFLRLAPIKAEIMHLNPTLMFYHDVLYENEIEAIKENAVLKLKRALVLNATSGESIPSSTRLSSLAWLYSDQSYLMKVDSRIEDITGLSLRTAEAYQVVHYGIFGHYQPHYDYLDFENDSTIGNRIATFLYYLNDVEAGGATIFPVIEISVKPEKGAAVLWYNVHFNGERDLATMHAACPVLAGEKWVANKWIRERGQEFRRPCLLSSTD